MAIDQHIGRDAPAAATATRLACGCRRQGDLLYLCDEAHRHAATLRRQRIVRAEARRRAGVAVLADQFACGGGVSLGQVEALIAAHQAERRLATTRYWLRVHLAVLRPEYEEARLPRAVMTTEGDNRP